MSSIVFHNSVRVAYEILKRIVSCFEYISFNISFQFFSRVTAFRWSSSKVEGIIRSELHLLLFPLVSVIETMTTYAKGLEARVVPKLLNGSQIK